VDKTKKRMKDIKEEFNKDKEIQKKNKFWKGKLNNPNLKTELKALLKGLNKLQTEHQELKISRGIISIRQTKEKIPRKYEWNMQNLWDTMKRPIL
jgi:hypothetical protein